MMGSEHKFQPKQEYQRGETQEYDLQTAYFQIY